jgi:hypothetical protein
MPKLKPISKDCIWHVAFMCWFIVLIFLFFIPNLQLHATYIYIFFIASWCYIILWCIHVVYHLKMNKICSKHIFKIHNFRLELHLEFKPKESKCIVNTNFTNLNSCFFKLSILRSYPILRKNKAFFIWKKNFCKNNNLKDCPQVDFECFKHAKWFLKHYKFESKSYHWNFAINEAYFQKRLTTQIIVFPWWFFKKSIIKF